MKQTSRARWPLFCPAPPPRRDTRKNPGKRIIENVNSINSKSNSKGVKKRPALCCPEALPLFYRLPLLLLQSFRIVQQPLQHQQKQSPSSRIIQKHEYHLSSIIRIEKESVYRVLIVPQSGGDFVHVCACSVQVSVNLAINIAAANNRGKTLLLTRV